MHFISLLFISAAILVLDESTNTLSKQGLSLFPQTAENLPTQFTPSCVCALSNLTITYWYFWDFDINTKLLNLVWSEWKLFMLSFRSLWRHSWCGKFCYSMVGSRRVWWEFMCLSSYISLFGDLLRWDRSLYSLSTGGFILLVVAHAWFFPVKFSTWKSCLLFYCCSCFDFLDCWPLYISLLFPVS